MSLLNHGPHTVTVYPEERFTDSRGNARDRPSQTGIEIRGCLMKPISSARDPLSDRRVDGGYHFSARSAPLGPWASVRFQGRLFTIEAGPLVHNASPATRRITATLIPAD